ncbi:MAG: AAA family ATPase [Pseudomonadota bacterium]|nr:AAA family ATPase [Pseudomonadota bacterium]
MIVADNETAVDLLYYEAIARTVVRLVSDKSDEPLSVGVHGDWGAGKSSVLMMVEEAFAKEDRVLCVRFNGWLFQGYEDAKAVLIETIVEELLRKRSTSAKVSDQAKQVLRRVDWMKIARKVGGLAFTAATGIPHPDTLKDLYAAVSGLVGKSAENITGADLKSVADQAGQYLKEAEPDAAPQQMHAFREEFEELLRRADIDRLVVLVDDLDRCLPETAIETLEAIRLFLFVPKAAFVIAADEGMIEYAVRQHFPDLPVATGPATYARNYLEKLIQVPFRLPSLGYAETRIYITLLLVLNECGEGSDEFAKLVGLAQQALQRPWKGPGLSREAVAKALGSVPDSVERALNLAHRIAPILTDGARGNPRQVKRFINTMMLRLAIAQERGFGDDINLTVLAKIMLAERFAPEVYDAIARGAAGTGVSQELIDLEAAVHGGEAEGATPKGGKKAAATVGEPPVFPDWPNLEWAKQWAKIDPPLAEYDLRPYVFVTRDRRSVFGAVTSLGELDELLAKLSGPPLQVRQATAAVVRLTSTEAEQLFDALRAKVAAAENLGEQPSGAQGLAAICQYHAFLQPSLVALLRSLPVSKLGPWVVTGWANAVTNEEPKAAFEALASEWAAQSENKQLQAAAKAVAKMRKPGSSR